MMGQAQRKIATPDWTTACPDWEKRIRDGESLIPFLPLFPAEASAAMDILGALHIVDAPGSPTFLEASRPWAMEFVSAIFGAYDAESGRRLIRNFFLLVSKKNSKSTLASAIMLTALLRNWRRSAEFLIVAPTIEVAHNSFDPARDMITYDKDLSALLHINRPMRTITHKNTGATLKVVAADNEAVSGKKATGVLVDELWLFGKRAHAEGMLREATGGLASRPEGFVIYLSTQSDEPPAGIFKQKIEEFRDIRDGVVEDPKSLGVFYEFPRRMLENNEFRDPKNFFMTNPNLGASVSEEFIVDEFKRAERAGDASLCNFAAKHLNVEIGISLRSNRWAGTDQWSKQADKTLTLEQVIERSEAIVVGIDGGGLDDLFGLCVLGRDGVQKLWLAWSHAWCHSGVLERRQTISGALLDFEKAGDLTIVDDELKDISDIIEIISNINEQGKLASVAVDPAGLGELIDALADVGITQEGKQVIGAPQGYAMMNAIKTAERKLANGTLVHSGSSLMSWAVSNLKIEPTATAIRATKQNAGDAKIDPAIAMFNAVTVMSANPSPPGAEAAAFCRAMLERGGFA